MTDQDRPPITDRTTPADDIGRQPSASEDYTGGPTDQHGVPTDRLGVSDQPSQSVLTDEPVPADEKVRASRGRVRPRKETSTTVSSVRRTRELVASAIITVAVLAAATLALGAVLIALHANQANGIVSTIVELADRLDGPFSDLFAFKNEAVKQTLVNWGIAAVVYLIAGRIVERVIRP